MKRCPECSRNYHDDSLLYCLEDGVALAQGLVPSPDEPATAIMPETAMPSEDPTRAQIHTAEKADDLPSGDSADQNSKSTGKRLLVALFTLVVIALGGFLAYRYFTSGNKQIESIAVMPFVNASGNPDTEYLSDGMTETLISSLSQLPNTDVKPRSSVFRYKGRDADPQTIGKELNVQAILNGRLTQRGQDISLYVELIDPVRNTTMWSETYNRKQSDLVSLQSEVARDVSGKLKNKLSGADEAKVTKTYTTNPEAYQLYLKGNYYRTKYTEDGYKKGIEYYKQAIAIDPNYALAYSGIAYAYITSADWYLAPTEAWPKFQEAVTKALEIDNTLADAHAGVAANAMWYERDWAKSEREFATAIELDPNLGATRQMYGDYLVNVGRFDEGLAQIELATRLAPFDLQFSGDLAFNYGLAGRYDQAIEQARKTIDMDQNYWYGHMALGLALERKKQFPEAIAALEKARAVDNNPLVLGYLGYVYAAAGEKAKALKVLDEMNDLSKQRWVPTYSIAEIYAGLNDKDKAFEWLERAYEAHSAIALLKVDTTLDNLRPDPRYKELLKRINLTE